MSKNGMDQLQARFHCKGCGNFFYVQLMSEQAISEAERKYGGGSTGAFVPEGWKAGYCSACQDRRNGKWQ